MTAPSEEGKPSMRLEALWLLQMLSACEDGPERVAFLTKELERLSRPSSLVPSSPEVEEKLDCGHPLSCLEPDYDGENTTSYCGWCADVEAEAGTARAVVRAAKLLAEHHYFNIGRQIKLNDALAAHDAATQECDR